MQTAFPLKITPSAAIQMQTQLSNLIAIQNLQDYLKYLILTTSIEPQGIKFPEESAEDLTQQSSPQKQDTTIMLIEEKEGNCDSGKHLVLSSDTFKSLGKNLPIRKLKSKKTQKLFNLMQKKYQGSKTHQQSEEIEQREDKSSVVPILKKSFKDKEVVCGHSWRDHYAKGLCGSCYLKFGRTKKPWNCTHEKLYALGLCQKCYAAKYNMKKKSVESEACNHEMKAETLIQSNVDQTNIILAKEPVVQGNVYAETEEVFVKIETIN